MCVAVNRQPSFTLLKTSSSVFSSESSDLNTPITIWKQCHDLGAGLLPSCERIHKVTSLATLTCLSSQRCLLPNTGLLSLQGLTRTLFSHGMSLGFSPFLFALMCVPQDTLTFGEVHSYVCVIHYLVWGLDSGGLSAPLCARAVLLKT